MSSRHSWCQILWWLSPLYLLFSHKNCIPWLPDWLADRLEGNIWKWQSGNIYFHPNWLARGQCKAMKPIIGFPTQQIGNFKSIYVMFNFEIEMEECETFAPNQEFSYLCWLNILISAQKKLVKWKNCNLKPTLQPPLFSYLVSSDKIRIKILLQYHHY